MEKILPVSNACVLHATSVRGQAAEIKCGRRAGRHAACVNSSGRRDRRSRLVLIFIEGDKKKMLYWAVVFLIIALVAGVLGFGGIAGASVGIARVLFGIFLVLFLVSLIAGRSLIR